VSRLAADQTELLRALARHGVDFVVVGGVAAQVHGWRGATADLDIAVSTEDSNVQRLNLALASVGAGNGTIGAFGTVFATRYGRLEARAPRPCDRSLRRLASRSTRASTRRGADRCGGGARGRTTYQAGGRPGDGPCRAAAEAAGRPRLRSALNLKARRGANCCDSFRRTRRGCERGWGPGRNRSRPVVTSCVPSCPRSTRRSKGRALASATFYGTEGQRFESSRARS
jgi:hypothetical protein